MAASSPRLTFSNRQFLLEGKPLRMFSAAIHYFRVVPEYWHDRLVKAKACGMNTIETYVPWNLHEPKPGHFKSDGILDLRKFIKMAADLDLYVIFRPGPYICSEWEFGGLPSWLLADPDMKVRSNYPGYTSAVERFFTWLLPLVCDLQRSNGGPIIAVQVENEFGSFSDEPDHMIYMRDLLIKNGVVELLVSCDNESAAGTGPIIDGVLPTANGHTVEELKPNFDVIKNVSPDYPLMVMEFWCGWFDHWSDVHETRSLDITEKALRFCLDQDASVNFYMFHGGTNFGFMSGALNLSRFKCDTTSYDYDAPLSEGGFLTDKAVKIRDMLQEEVSAKKLGNKIPESLPDNPAVASKPMSLVVKETLAWNDLMDLVTKKTKSHDFDYMENFVYQQGDVQSYGYIVYRKVVEMTNDVTLALPGPVRDRVTVMLDGKVQGVLTRAGEDPSPSLDLQLQSGASGSNVTLDVVVENLGRVNYTLKEKQSLLSQQRKGLKGTGRLGESDLHDFEVFALDFEDEFVQRLSGSKSWVRYKKDTKQQVPAVFRTSVVFPRSAPSTDFFLRLENWGKGLVFINGFNLGRYWEVGPTQTLYLPAPLLKKGANEVIVVEELKCGGNIVLDTKPSLGPTRDSAKV